MRIPDIMPFFHLCRKSKHIQISAKESGSLYPGEGAPADFLDGDVFADIGKAARTIIGRSVKRDRVSLQRESAGQAETLPLAATFHQQLMHDQGNVHCYIGVFGCI